MGNGASANVASAVECVLQSLDRYGRLDEPQEDLAARSGTSVSTVRRAVRLVQSLEPAGVAAKNLSECLCLQLVRLGETGLPLIIARKHLEDMGRNHYHQIARLTGADRNAVQAKWVVRNVEHRRATLLACVCYIADWQREFFRHGPGNLRPLSMADTAAGLGVHESTVSRAIHDKYLQCALRSGAAPAYDVNQEGWRTFF